MFSQLNIDLMISTTYSTLPVKLIPAKWGDFVMLSPNVCPEDGIKFTTPRQQKQLVMKTKHRNIRLRFQESPTPLISTGNGFSENIYSLLNVKFVLTFIWRVTRYNSQKKNHRHSSDALMDRSGEYMFVLSIEPPWSKCYFLTTGQGYFPTV